MDVRVALAQLVVGLLGPRRTRHLAVGVDGGHGTAEGDVRACHEARLLPARELPVLLLADGAGERARILRNVGRAGRGLHPVGHAPPLPLDRQRTAGIRVAEGQVGLHRARVEGHLLGAGGSRPRTVDRRDLPGQDRMLRRVYAPRLRDARQRRLRGAERDRLEGRVRRHDRVRRGDRLLAAHERAPSLIAALEDPRIDHGRTGGGVRDAVRTPVRPDDAVADADAPRGRGVDAVEPCRLVVGRPLADRRYMLGGRDTGPERGAERLDRGRARSVRRLEPALAARDRVVELLGAVLLEGGYPVRGPRVGHLRRGAAAHRGAVVLDGVPRRTVELAAGLATAGPALADGGPLAGVRGLGVEVARVEEVGQRLACRDQPVDPEWAAPKGGICDEWTRLDRDRSGDERWQALAGACAEKETAGPEHAAAARRGRDVDPAVNERTGDRLRIPHTADWHLGSRLGAHDRRPDHDRRRSWSGSRNPSSRTGSSTRRCGGPSMR